MAYNELFAKSFQYGLMFGKDIEPGKAAGVSVTDIHDIVLALKKAYVDMSPRTFRNNDSEEHTKALDSNRKDALFSKLAKEFADYMTNGVDDFERWHHELCVFFIVEFSEILKAAGKSPEDATYGKAQKIINMTFKYLYCFDDAALYADRFEPCHMALDSYILNWVNEWYPEQYNKGKSPEERLSRYGRNQLPNWSRLAYNAENGRVPQYIEIQNAIKEKVSREFDMPCIEAEFIIWYNQRNKLSKKERKA